MKKFFLFLAIAAAMWQPAAAQTADTNDIVWKIKNEECYAVEFSPDSKFIASIGTQYVRVFNVEDGTIFKEFPLPVMNYDTDITWSSDGKYLAAVGNFGIKVWQTDTYTEIPIELNDGNPWNTVNNAHFIHNNTQLIVSTKKTEQSLVIFNLLDGKKVKSVSLKPDHIGITAYLVMNLDVSYDNKYILAYVYVDDFSYELNMNLTYLVDGNTYEIIKTKLPPGNHKFFNHSNKVLVFGEYGVHKGMLIWDIEKNDIEKSINTVVKPFYTHQPTLSLTPEDMYFLFGDDWDPISFSVYNIETGKLIYKYNPNLQGGKDKYAVSEMDVSKNGKYVVTGDELHIILYKENWNKTSIETENDTYNTITTYPDPINNNVRLDVTVTLPGIYDLDLYNESGVRVNSIYSGTMEAGTSSYTLNTNNISSGIYFIHLFGNGLNLNKKILVVR